MKAELRELSSQETEKAVLGTILLNPGAFVEESISVDDFCGSVHRAIVSAMSAIDRSGEVVSVQSVGVELEKAHELKESGGYGYLWELTQEAHEIGLPGHVKILREYKDLRALHEIGVLIELEINAGHDVSTVLANASRRMSAIYGQALESWKPMAECVNDACEEIERKYKGEDPPGLSTSITALDQMIGGLNKGDFVVVAGRPSMGKSALMLGMARAASQGGSVVGIVSLEMTQAQLTKRMMSQAHAHLTVVALERGQLTDAGWHALVDTSQGLAVLPIYISKTFDSTIQSVRAQALKLKQQRGLDVLMVDYLGLMRSAGKEQHRVQVVDEISAGFKRLAIELDIPVVVLCQLNRKVEDRPDKKPILSDLRESGSIEQDTDVVIMLYREEYYFPENTDCVGMSEILVKKNRHGPTGEVRAKWVGTRAIFENF